MPTTWQNEKKIDDNNFRFMRLQLKMLQSFQYCFFRNWGFTSWYPRKALFRAVGSWCPTRAGRGCCHYQLEWGGSLFFQFSWFLLYFLQSWNNFLYENTYSLLIFCIRKTVKDLRKLVITFPIIQQSNIFQILVTFFQKMLQN